MSKIKAFVVAAIVAASGSAAMADTAFSAHASARVSFGTPAPVVRDHRHEPVSTVVSYPSTPAPASWVTLAADMTTNNGPLVVYPSSSLALSQIRLETISATAMIDGVTVQFADGGSQYFTPSNHTLDVNNPTFTIQLGNRQVSKIAIDGWSARANADFKVVGLAQNLEPVGVRNPEPTYQHPFAREVAYARPVVVRDHRRY
ncbi:MAG TPA: hypothetical protein VGM90_04980 [Kofleriaceae bacterium]|jgi:hypothetical protein